ncbi:LacI family transcriptional regulator [Ruminiclostridium sufflavum DSM 19573]|uniref:LacI family transcriptional regulator n=1 Tax=Ruminiclostridium sufflavum DSM 19573 TaxID=1121337 RepID=A0A318XKQ5_9FIRM|nr:LacI family DNA-binding transcriptional regulator [Ruminiclostridium sufflavum]PYG87126.1 LacI family transcriptional regulator [Ruminiclostridium sufflavum DSM 19573]
MVSIKDVAKMAGVSPTTVSAVVNNHDCVKLSTREKILKVINELGYIPNISARELVTNKKQNIGLITTGYDNFQKNGCNNDKDIFYIEYINGIAEAIKTTGYGLLIENFVYEEGSKEIPKIIEQKRVDGAMIVGSLYKKEFIELLKKEINVLVTVGTFSEFTDYVINDYTESILMAVRYFVKNGHRKIAYVSGDSKTYACPLKLLGYKEGLKEAGIKFDNELLFESKFMSSHGYDVAKKICELPKEKFPTAVIFGADILAAGACRYFYENKIYIPEDISILGYENLSISSYINPPLTSIDWNKNLMSKEACSLILRRLKNPNKKYDGIVLPCNIVERKSVKNLN